MKFTSRLLGITLLASTLVSAALAAEGSVVSTIATAGYTYIEINRDGKTQWLAADVIELKPGERIRFDEAALMMNFHSSSLQRDFASVLFVNEVKTVPEK